MNWWSGKLKKGGPFIGPRGGKWADAKHTIPWDKPHDKVLFHSTPAYAMESLQKRLDKLEPQVKRRYFGLYLATL